IGSVLPHPQDPSHYPSSHVIQNHVHHALVSEKYSGFDQLQKYLCSFHREQAWMRWTRQAKIKLSPSEQKQLLDHLRDIASAPSESSCDREVERLKESKVYKSLEVRNYVDRRWLCVRERWCRAYAPHGFSVAVTTNNGVEALNKSLKSFYLKFSSTGSLSSLLETLVYDAYLYKKSKTNITESQRTEDTEMDKSSAEIIIFYLSLLMKRNRNQVGSLKVFSFSTFFYPKLQSGEGHATVKNWTKAVDLFLFDLVFVPLHLGMHWALAVIDFKSQTIQCYDSIGQRHDEICHVLLKYLTEEYRVKKGCILEAARWTVGRMRTNAIPKQVNGNDCGVFTCKYADFLSQGKPLTFRQTEQGQTLAMSHREMPVLDAKTYRDPHSAAETPTTSIWDIREEPIKMTNEDRLRDECV
ncbi:hypothetical protein QQF64_033946, partial [Cirrhinus molitorella]